MGCDYAIEFCMCNREAVEAYYIPEIDTNLIVLIYRCGVHLLDSEFLKSMDGAKRYVIKENSILPMWER